MSGLKDIRTRINSITSTQKITSAMKMVSAAKFHKAQDIYFRFKPYSEKVSEVLEQVSADTIPDGVKWFGKPKSMRRIALVVITSNSSMCSGFNQNLIKKVIEDSPKLFAGCWNTENMHVICLGKKGADALAKRGFKLEMNNTEIALHTNFDDVSRFCDESLLNRFKEDELDAVFVAYNQFKNPAQQEPVIRQFLPSPFSGQHKLGNNFGLIFEPDREYINKVLIPMSLNTFFYEIILENAIGEHGARMTAMHQATENAIDLTKELKLQYNKARQSAITKEILEIVSGAEALKG